MLGAQVALQLTPVFGRVSKTEKERGFEPADRVAAREQVTVQLRRFDNRAVSVRDLQAF
jgi:hypothetical protein